MEMPHELSSRPQPQYGIKCLDIWQHDVLQYLPPSASPGKMYGTPSSYNYWQEGPALVAFRAQRDSKNAGFVVDGSLKELTY